MLDMKRWRRLIPPAALLGGLMLHNAVLAQGPKFPLFPYDRVSTTATETQGDRDTLSPSISSTGRYVAYSSYATNLVIGDTNAQPDIFVKDRQTRTVQRVSTTSSGAQANRDSYNPSISSNGRYVAFLSYATNLMAGDTNNAADIFVKDRQTGAIVRASAAGDGSQANGDSYTPSISGDGKYVAFFSYADNLVAGDANGVGDVFVKDLTTGAVVCASTPPGGPQGNADSYSPSLSADGSYVAFYSTADNLVAGDTNDLGDVFVTHLTDGAIVRVSEAEDGTEGNGDSYTPSINANGRFVAFTTESDNILTAGDDFNGASDVYVKDLTTGEVWLVSGDFSDVSLDFDSYSPSISGDGRYIAFANAYPPTDVLVKDMSVGCSCMGSFGATDGQSYSPSLSGDGRHLAFASDSAELHPFDTNQHTDVYVFSDFDLADPVTTVSLDPAPNAKGFISADPVTVTLTATDDDDVAEIFYSVDGGAPEVYTSPFTVTGEGEHVIVYSAVDVNGHLEFDTFPDFKSVTFTIDTTSPTATVTATNADGSPYTLGAWTNQDVTVHYDCTDTNGITSGGCPADDVVSAEGQANLSHTVTDSAGNTDNVTADVWIDKTAPTVTSLAASPTGGSYMQDQPVSVSYACDDALSGVASCAGDVPSGGNLDTSVLGGKTFTVAVTDAAGNTNTDGINYSVSAGINNAEFVSYANVPSQMALGSKAVVSVTMKNTGTSYWSYNRKIVLSSQNTLANKSWGTNHRYLPGGVVVAPGQTHTFTFVATAPTLPGTYKFQWRMAQTGVQWFGEFSTNKDIDVYTNDAKFEPLSPFPNSLLPGQKVVYSIKMTNTGSTTWTRAGGYVLTAQNPLANNLWGTNLRYLPAGVSVAPGQSYTFTFVATAPLIPNTYHFQWRMAQTGIGWFGEFSNDTAVTVGP